MKTSQVSAQLSPSTALSHLNVPNIAPVSLEIQRPFWSVMIPTYDGTKYLEQTLRCVLDQDPGLGQMQIEVIDDCSTEDDPESLVNEIGQGRISYFRHLQNQGLIGNWNTCIQRAKGHWVHMLHQDDIVLPGFYSQLQKGIEADPALGAAFCRHSHMDEDNHWHYLSNIERRTPGVLMNWIESIAVSQRIQFPSIVVKRSAYEKLGGFCNEAYYAADWEMWKRVSAHYPVWYEPQILACYRRHSGSETSRLVRSGVDIADIRKAIGISQAYLPAACAHSLSDQARKYYAFYALNTARQMLTNNDMEGAIAQIKEALRCSSSLKVLRYLFSLLKSGGTQWVFRQMRLR